MPNDDGTMSWSMTNPPGQIFIGEAGQPNSHECVGSGQDENYGEDDDPMTEKVKRMIAYDAFMIYVEEGGGLDEFE